MDKKLLIEVLRKNTATSEQEAMNVISLKKQYPFSQALQVIAAKVSKDHHLDSQQLLLQQAAVYATDRSVLKEIMTSELVNETHAALPAVPLVSETKKQPIPVQNIAPPAKEQSEKIVTYSQIEKTIDSVDVADVIMEDLMKLSRLKHNFELLFTDQKSMSVVVNHETIDQNNAETIDGVKSRREKIIELSKARNNSEATPLVVRRNRKDGQSDLIEEIKTSKEEIEPGTERLKEQIELIDQFIKIQPSIPPAKERIQTAPTDFNSIKSGEFGENIVSETLVEILIKQGKKDRAIEVLKKLIWKYPQKKAYFASQIEDLKK